MALLDSILPFLSRRRPPITPLARMYRDGSGRGRHGSDEGGFGGDTDIRSCAEAIHHRVLGVHVHAEPHHHRYVGGFISVGTSPVTMTLIFMNSADRVSAPERGEAEPRVQSDDGARDTVRPIDGAC